jgi:hypothetical protein
MHQQNLQAVFINKKFSNFSQTKRKAKMKHSQGFTILKKHLQKKWVEGL